jgi:hypothetical protein
VNFDHRHLLHMGKRDLEPPSNDNNLVGLDQAA